MTQGLLVDLDVSRETLDQLHRLVALLAKWNPVINLVSKSSLNAAWPRHIQDSAQLFALAPMTAEVWADLGSGGGFPGLVIAVLAKELRPQMVVHLVESDQRKATFLRQAVSALGVNAKVHAERIEKVPPIGADIVSARALATLDSLCGFAHHHLADGGTALFPKGANHTAEIPEAQKHWTMHLTPVPSKTEPGAVVLKIEGLAHA